MPRRALLSILLFLWVSACGDPATSPRLDGQWGSQVASLQLSRAGGNVQYQCGAGTIDPGWTLTNEGRFLGVGEHFFGGGPLPPQGWPGHPASYAGHLVGSRLILTVTVTDLNQVLGPFELVRDGPPVSNMCV